MSELENRRPIKSRGAGWARGSATALARMGVTPDAISAGSVVFLALAPGVVAGLVPWLLTGWSSAGPPAWLQAVGWVA